MFEILNKNSKKLMYAIISLISLISVIIFLSTIKSQNRKFNENLIKSASVLFLSNLEKLNNNNVNKDRIMPFKIVYESLENENSKIYFDSDSNTLKVIPNYDLEEIINHFAIYTKESNSTIISNNLPKINIHRCINIYILIDNNKNIEDYNDTISLINKINANKSIFIKFLFYNGNSDLEKNINFYENLKTMNSKNLFDDLNDEGIIKLIIHDSNETQIKTFYNKEINNNIYSLNFKQNLNAEFIEYLINLENVDKRIKSQIKDQQVLDEVLKIYNSPNFIFSNMLASTLKNLEKLNKIFGLYENIRTIEEIKEKVLLLFISSLILFNLV